MLVQLARRWEGPITIPVSLADVAADEDLPRAYLEQLAIPLREAGVVISTRGARGGYALARPPAEVTMAEVLRALEGPLAPMICASEDPAHAGACLRVGACSVNSLWIHVRDAIGGVLEATTLADLIPAPHRIELRARPMTTAVAAVGPAAVEPTSGIPALVDPVVAPTLLAPAGADPVDPELEPVHP